MNIILIGFSTTGKSSILKLKELRDKLSNDVQLIDSDSEISKDYDHHIYNLFIQNHISNDPIHRNALLNTISSKEEMFIHSLKENKSPYIAALGPNIHIRSNWQQYFLFAKPYTIFLKANAESVFEGLKRREEQLVQELSKNPAFGNWNHGVIRQYNIETAKYELLSKEQSIDNIKKLIKVNEDYYSQIANITIEATKLFEWHSDYDSNEKKSLIDFMIKNAG